jgi:hypothetical protein
VKAGTLFHHGNVMKGTLFEKIRDTQFLVSIFVSNCFTFLVSYPAGFLNDNAYHIHAEDRVSTMKRSGFGDVLKIGK